MIAAAVLLALRVGGLDPATLAVGGAITAVVIGLAAQQTLGNLIAGMVLIAARPFRVGDRVRLQAGAVAGQIEGVVGSLGLLYTTFAQGQDSIMVPNNVVLTAAVVPLREPAGSTCAPACAPTCARRDVQACSTARPHAGARRAAHRARGARLRRGRRARDRDAGRDSDGPSSPTRSSPGCAEVTREARTRGA